MSPRKSRCIFLLAFSRRWRWRSTMRPATNAARVVQDVLGIHQDAIQAEAYVRTFLKQSTSTRAAFVAGRMVERQRQRREKARQQMRRLLRALLKRGEKAWG